jgi:hypothetical protein
MVQSAGPGIPFKESFRIRVARFANTCEAPSIENRELSTSSAAETIKAVAPGGRLVHLSVIFELYGPAPGDVQVDDSPISEKSSALLRPRSMKLVRKITF